MKWEKLLINWPIVLFMLIIIKLIVTNEHQFKKSGFDYRSMLNGIICYELNNSNEKYYTGLIKLKKDP